MELPIFSVYDSQQEVFAKCTSPACAQEIALWLDSPDRWLNKTRAARRLRQKNPQIYSLGFVAYCLDQQRQGFVEFIENSSGPYLANGQCDIDVVEALQHFYDPFVCSLVSNTSGLRELQMYINGSMSPMLNAYVQFGGHLYEDSCENHEIECQGLRQTVKSLISWVPTIFNQGINWTVDTIVEAIKRHFGQLLEQFCPTAHLVCGWIGGIWEKIKQWTEEAWQYLGCCFEAFSEILHVGIAILSVTLALNVVEQVLLMIKVLPVSLGLGALFCKGAMAAVLTLELATHHELVPRFIGLVQYVTNNYACAMASIFVCKYEEAKTPQDDEFVREMRENLNPEAQRYVSAYFSAKQEAICRQEQKEREERLRAKFEEMYAEHQREVQPQASPLTLLEIFAAGLKEFASGGLVGMGRTMNAITQINNGIKSVKELAGRIFQVLGDLIYQIFGLEATLLQDASILLADDLTGWLEDIQSLQQQFFLKAYCTQKEVCEMHALRKRGVDMQKVMLSSGRKFSPPVIRVLNEGIKLLEKLVQECSIKGAPMPRKIPFCIFFQGESRVGKSLLMNKFVTEMQKELGLPADQVYARNGLDEYWSGYRRQSIVIYDDFGAVQTEPGIEAEFIPLISSAPLPLNMASLHEKGMFFDSQVVIASTNFLEPSPESQIRDKDAFRNRRHVLVQVVKDPTKEYDPTDFTANQRYNLLSHTGLGNYRTIREFESYSDLHVFIINKWNDHNVEQEKNLMQYGEAMFDVEQPVKHMRDVLQLSRSLTGFVSQISDAESSEQNTVHFLTFEHLGKLRSFWWNEETMEIFERPVEFIKQEQIEAELKRTGQMSLIIYEFLKLNEKTNIIIKNNLADLACADMWDQQFNYVGQIGKPAFNSMLIPEIMQLPKWQRIALCCIGSYFNREKRVSFVTRLLGKLKDFLITLYKQEFSEWPVAAKILVGIAFASLAAVGMWKMCEMLRSAVGGASIVSAAATAFTTRPSVEAQSKKPNRYDVSSYKYRNVPLRQRAWAQAQMSIDQSHVMLMEKVMASFSFGLNKIQVVMVPGRRFIGFTHALQQIKHPVYGTISTSSRSYKICFDPANLTIIPDSELCVYESNQVEDVPASSWDLFAWDPEVDIPEIFSGHLFSSKWQHQSQTYLNECAEITVNTEKKGIVVCEGAYRREIPVALRYEAPTVKSDCGSIVVFKAGTKLKIAGIHVAGDGKNGYACFLPPLQPKVQAQSAQIHFDMYPCEQETASGIALVGKLKDGLYVSCPTKTSFEKTPEAYHLDLPCEKEPSILSGSDPRITEENKGFCPFASGIKKYAEPMGLLDHDLLYEVANDMKETWFDCCEDMSFPEVDLATAINGIDFVEYMECIPKSTSEGFPHVLSRGPGEKGKMRFLEGDGEKFVLKEGTTVAENYKLLVESCKNDVPTLVAIECPKDEKLPLRKIYQKPKTRCFSILPMEYNLLVRQKFLHFVRFQMMRRDVLPSQVGINPYSMEWGRIARRLQEVGNDILCCDYSSFDGLMSTQVMSCLADTMNDFMGGEAQLKRERKNLLLACCSRFSIVKGEVWRVEGGIPSGFPLTVVMNGLFNELLVRYCYKKILRQAGANDLEIAGFHSYIRFVVYGDDNLISVSPTIHDKFNGTLLKQEMGKFGVTITDGKDKTSPTLNFRRLEDCDFLKRGFVKRTDLIWDAPEEKASLYTQLHYVSTKMQSMEEAYLGNLVNVLRELYMHDPAEACLLRRKALRTLPWLNINNVGTIDSIKGFYAMQRAGYRMDETIDLICDVNRLGKYVKEEPCREILALTPTVAVCDLAYFNPMDAPEDELWILCQTNFHELDDNRFIQLKWTPGGGRGGLPPLHWLRTALVMEKSNLRKRLNHAFSGAKKRIVFATRGGILIPTVLASIFLMRQDPNLHLAGNAALTCAMQNVKTLGFLKQDCLSLF